MPTVVGVRLRFASKTLWFDPADSDPAEGDRVVVETERGRELGDVVQAPFEVSDAELPAALKPVVRIATADDVGHAEQHARLEAEAMPVFRQLVAERKLDMKPVAVEYLHDGDKIVFYFSAEERVDFRELVRDLASRFHARIDLRQIGVRDEARLVGGVGHCGQQLCCARLSGDFQPVSIRMAKEQDLPLNPLKISGLCGRLMCCLRYEYDAYKDFKSRAPKRGAMIETPVGTAKVTDLNTPRELVTMRLQDGESLAVPLASMGCCKGSDCPCSVSEEALEAIRPTAATAVAPSLFEMPTPAPAPAKPGQGGSESQAPREGRRRRRRSKPAEAQAPAAAAPAPQAPEGQGASPSGDGERTGRKRRRRRRRSGGGGGGGGDAAGA